MTTKKLDYDLDSNPLADLQCSQSANNQNLTKISKEMSWILRHGAIKSNITITKNGFISLDVLTKRLNVTPQDIACIVVNDNKERYKMIYKKNTHDIYVRANQGHSMSEISIEMNQIKDPSQIPTAVHGTYYNSWNLIKTSGLKIMGRQHVHFAKGLPGESNVISGMRSDVQILIYVDIDKMLQDKIKIYESENGVILSEGINGVIEPKYFKVVMDAKTKKQLYPTMEDTEPKKIVGANIAQKKKKNKSNQI
jgi:2'-phosphotransferase